MEIKKKKWDDGDPNCKQLFLKPATSVCKKIEPIK